MKLGGQQSGESPVSIDMSYKNAPEAWLGEMLDNF